MGLEGSCRGDGEMGAGGYIETACDELFCTVEC